MPVGFDTTPLSGGNRGTGSARRRSNDAIGIAQMTPPPDPRRTDREALARRRTAQVEAAITQARTLLGQRKFDEALDACQQALTLDETHTGALELEEEIQTALRIQEGVEIAADDSVDSALTAAAEPSSFHPGLAASRLLESQVVTRAHEQAFVVTGLPPASSERPLTGTVPPSAVAPVAAPTQPVPAVVAGIHERRVSAPTKWVGAAIAAVAAAAVAAFMLTGGTPATGMAVIDAAPWANITEIRNEAGVLQPLPSPPSTPVSLALPAGTYQISLAGPPPQSKKETVTLRVNAGQTSVAPVTRLQSLTVEEYFDESLGGAR
jgi:hypothetical protein